jgi:hypothetical protein
MVVAAVISGPCPRDFFLAKSPTLPGLGVGPLVHFPGCHVMGSLRPIWHLAPSPTKTPRGWV